MAVSNIFNIRIDQAIFGYREGHRLLQASRKFVPTTERILLTLTDMSGSRMLDGFEEYVSGYPVPDEESYAFVKTWYAPEMERPGCVWSHVLVIRNADLAKVTDLSHLVPLFRRPLGGDLQHYISPAWPFPESASPFASIIKIEDAEALVAALYDDKEKPVIIPSHDSLTLEPLILAVWSQQWPALRAVFRFCTGALSNRVFAGRSFDLQVVPNRLLRELQRDSTAFVFQPIPGRPLGSSESASWLSVAAADLAAGMGSFRDFLWRYTDSGAGQRSLYSKMGQLFTYFQRFSDSTARAEAPQITQRITGAFPEPTSGVVLKQQIYGPVAPPGWHLPFIGEEARLMELAKTSHWRSFDPAQLSLRERAGTFWKDAPYRSKPLLLELLNSPTNPLADEILIGFVEALDVVEACEIAKERPGLLLALVMRNPHLVASEEFWRCRVPTHTFYGILDFLKSDKAAGIPPQTWIPFLIESGTDTLASPVVERFAADTVNAFLQRASNRPEKENWIPGTAWRGALSTCQHELLVLLSSGDYAASSRAMTLFAGLLDAHHQGIASHGLRPWLTLVKQAPDVVLQFPNADAAGFLLSLGFQRSERDALELITPYFEHVHAAAEDNAQDPLSYRTWESLELDVPALSWSRNWDKCERLRQALVARFIRNQWPRQNFLQCVAWPTTLRSVLYSCRDLRGGEDFAVSVAEGVFSGLLTSTEPQKAVFQSSFRRGRRGEIKLDL